jgi:hypothetical protein
MILMLVNVVGAKSDDCGVTLITDNCTQSVDFLKFPACGCDCGCGDTGCEVKLVTDPYTQSVDFLKFPTCGCGATRRGVDTR